LKIAKCAFAATVVDNQFIFVFGGFDGQELLNTVERYSYSENLWTLLEFRFRSGLCKAGAIQHYHN
jgi:kelch-like protein 10